MASSSLRERLIAAARNLERARLDRDRTIVEASEQGMSRREVADAVGLTAGRIQHIVNGARSERP